MSSTSTRWNTARRRSRTFPCIAEAGAIRDLGARLRFIMDGADAGDRHARLIEATIVPTLAYAARRVPEISDDIAAIDDAMRWGFAQERGIFETWDMLGVAQTVARMEKSGIAVAPWVKEMLAAGHTTFYRTENGRSEVYSPITQAVRTRPARRGADRPRRAQSSRKGSRRREGREPR